MIKISPEASARQIERQIDRLPIAQKIKLLRKLERQTLRQRWQGILRDIDRRLKKFPVSSEVIEQEIKAYRKTKRRNA